MGNEGESQSVLGARGWSTSGKLVTGNGRNLGTELQANPTGTVVKLQADFERPGEYTITFGIDTLGALSMCMAEALVIWDVEGNEVRRRVSIQNGVSISGCGQSVAVTMWDTTPTVAATNPYTTGPYTANVPYNVSAQCIRGVRSTKANPAILVPPPFQAIGGLALAGTPVQFSPGVAKLHQNDQIFYPIPIDAGITGVMVLVDDLVNGGGTGSLAGLVTASLQNPAGGGFATAQWAPTQFPNVWVPLTAGGNVVGVFDASTGAGLNIAATTYFAVDG